MTATDRLALAQVAYERERYKEHRQEGALPVNPIPKPPIGMLTLNKVGRGRVGIYLNVSVEPVGSHGFLRVVSEDGLTRTIINPTAYDSAVFEEHQSSKETT